MENLLLFNASYCQSRADLQLRAAEIPNIRLLLSDYMCRIQRSQQLAKLVMFNAENPDIIKSLLPCCRCLRPVRILISTTRNSATRICLT